MVGIERKYDHPSIDHNVLICPFTDIMDTPSGGHFHKGGPLWEKWEFAGSRRYHNNGTVADQIPEKQDIKSEVWAGKSAWLGPQFPHFGHGICDGATRCFASGRNKEIDIFIIGDKVTNKAGILRPFVASILEWFNIENSKVRVANKQVIASDLYTFPQAEQTNLIGPTSDYIAALTEHQDIKFKSCRFVEKQKFFISRANTSAHIAGEIYIESVFEKAGYKVIHPESIPLENQLSIYAHAAELVFSEGAALHAIQLLGKIPAKVSVLNRRPNSRIGEHVVRPRVSHLEYFELGSQLIFGCRVSGEPAPETGISIPNIVTLQECLSKIIGDEVTLDKEMLDDIIMSDVNAWMLHEKTLARFNHDNYIRQLASTVSLTGLKSRYDFLLER